jgi:hypothetical protein
MTGDIGGSQMATAASKSIQTKRPNLSREGAELQRSVSGELNWVRESVKAGRTLAGKILGHKEASIKPKSSKKKQK